MGTNINLLSERIIEKKRYDEDARLELIENIHFHYKDLRFVFNGKDFYNIATIFEQAKQKFIELGMPESSNNSISLGGTSNIGKGYHSNRLGCELTSDGTVHIHYRDLRIHMKQADFLVFAETIYHGLLTLSGCDISTKVISLDGVVSGIANNGLVNNVIIPDPVKNEYIKFLKEYDEGKYEKVSADDVIFYYMKTKYYERGADKGAEGIQRPNGLPDKYPCYIPEELNKKYLFTIYESIKKYGYVKGPFLNEYIVAHKVKVDGLDKIYITGAHRIAALIHLEYKEIIVTLVDK